MASRIHLVRHAEVHNPGHVVYASLPGFGLSDLGRLQAREAARYLGSQPIVAVWSSPLQRALETAAPIAGRLGLPVRIDEELTEWRLSEGWAGQRWEDLPTSRPGELEAYLEHPDRLPFSAESLAQLAMRMRAVLDRLNELHPQGDVVVVSHQDPVQAARLSITGTDLSQLNMDKPEHASVATIRPGTPWREEVRWSPGSRE